MRDPKHLLRKTSWLLFWLLAMVSLLIVLLFAYAAVPMLVALAQGSHARIWFFGQAGFVTLAAALYLAVAIAVLARGRSRRARRRL